MRQIRKQRENKLNRREALVKLVLGPLVFVGALGLGHAVVRADAVDDLKQALGAIPPGDPSKLSQDYVDYRRKSLQDSIDKLRTVGPLRRALTLDEWAEAPSSAQSLQLAEIDADARKQVGQRLIKAIHEVVEKGKPTSRMAVAADIADIGPTIRSVSEGTAGFTRGLTPEVIQLARDKDLGVRMQALRALGTIFPDPKEAVPVFQEALEKDNVESKRLAADGLTQLIKVASHLRNLKTGSANVMAQQSDVLEATVAVLSANRAGLKDADPVVRAKCLRNIQVAAEALADLIPDAKSRKTFPPDDRKLNPDEVKTINDMHAAINRKIKELLPTIDALRADGPTLARSLEDSNPDVRQAALDALESLGYARVRLKKLVNSVPFVKTDDKMDDGGNRELLKSNDTVEAFIGKNLDAITRLLKDPDVSVRRKAVDFLETIEEDAVPALPLLTASLQDKDRFVRIAAARAIANIAILPDQAAFAVPSLARLLRDPDLDVRMSAAKTLMEIGTAAQAAAPELAAAVNNGDVEARVLVMDTLRNIGPEKGKLAVPELITALKSPDVRIRRLAPKVLGSFGSDAQAALPALRERIGDGDQEVRQNASEAILEIEPLR